MKAVVLRGPNDVQVEDVADPVLLAGTDAIVRVDAAAICGADLGPLHGHVPGFEYGTIMGHEFAGRSSKSAPMSRRSGPAIAW